MNEIMPWVNSILLLVVAWLLARKDQKQGDDIAQLYALHHDNEKQLADHRLKIAENHYPKPEVDNRFMQLETTIKDGFRSLSTDFKEMTKALHDHLSSSHHSGQ